MNQVFRVSEDCSPIKTLVYLMLKTVVHNRIFIAFTYMSNITRGYLQNIYKMSSLLERLLKWRHN